MSWKFVFNSNNLGAGTHIDKAIEVCLLGKYQFMTWNGTVYFVDKEGKKYLTDITTDDLF